jgi:hypothetical protein
MMRCICLLYNIIIHTEGTTHEHSVRHETSQIHVSCQAKKMSAVDRSVRPQKEQQMQEMFSEHTFNGPAVDIPPHNQQAYLR